LPRAVRAEEVADLARGHGQIEAVERPGASFGFLQEELPPLMERRRARTRG
jgi:hypothetical protein